MAYEEASVAGETPDRSKQRKSSGKPTGAEPSVPAPGERDPRLAVAREVPAAREDQATAVFSTRAVPGGKSDEASETSDTAEASDETSEPSEASGTPEPSEAPEASEAPEGNGDARLRAAVAAWVASADEEAPEGAETAKEEGSTGAEAAEASGEDTAADAAPSAAGGSSGDSDSDSEAEAEAEADSPDEGAAADAASSDAEGPSGGSDSDSEAEAETGSPDESAAADAEVPSEGADAADDAADDEAEASSDADADGPDQPSAEGETSEDSEASEPADSTEGDAPADGDGDGVDEDPDEDPDDDSDGDKASEAPTGGVDQATAVFKALPRKAVDQPTTMLKLGDLKPESKKPEAGKAEGKGSAKAEEKPAAKPDEKPEAKPAAKSEAKPAAKPEDPAERTSRFVALKPLDAAAASGALPPLKETPAAGSGTEAGATPPSSVGPERTTQQPLPPKPPIDLLAELTNTPPPAETRVRTAVRRVKIWTPLVLLMVIVFAVVQAVRPLPTPSLTLTAKETVSFEGGKPSMPWPGQGQAAMDVNGIGSFGTSGKQKPVPIASIAKVMTVYLVLRDHPLKKGGNNGPDIPVDAAAEKHYETGKAENESVVKVTEGQKISEYEALQAVMLPSANNVAKLLARWDTKSDSEDEFVAKMNKTAKELGMKNTHYTDPSGLDKTTVSTAEDLVKLGRAAMEDPVFNEISRQPSYKDLNDDKQNNFFGLVPTVAIGIKTGTTTAAGGNILFAAEKEIGGETRTIIGAALGQYGQDGVANIDEVTGVTRKLIEAGQGALTAKTIVEKGDVVGEVDDGLGGTTPVVATKDVAAAGWSGLTVKLKLGEDGGETIPHSAKAGTKVGVLSVGDGKEGAVEVPVALQKDLTEPGFGAKIKRVG